jgi:site-specific recombinase XerD
MLPARLFTPTPKAAKRVLEFFTTQINNDHTRKAYLNAARRFADWCEQRGIPELGAVEPIHVAAFIKQLQGEFSAPTVKQHVAAVRILFDWQVTGQILETNPAHAVRGPKYVIKKGKTPVLASDEARTLLDSIETNSLIGLRDRALIATMIYTFARVNAVLPMKVRDYFVQSRRGCVRYTKKAARSTKCPVITIWRSTSTNTSRLRVSPAIRMVPSSARRPGKPVR